MNTITNIVTISPKYNKTTAKDMKEVNALSVLDAIRDTKFKSHTDYLRTEKNKEKRDTYKKAKLPVVMWSGLFNKHRRKEELKIGTGIACYDFDDYDRGEEIKGELKGDKHILAMFISPSGGLKVLLKIPISKTAEEHDTIYMQGVEHFKKYSPKADTSSRDVSRCCFLSHDPNLYVNENAEVLKVDMRLKIDKPIKFLKQETPNKCKVIEEFFCKKNMKGKEMSRHKQITTNVKLYGELKGGEIKENYLIAQSYDDSVFNEGGGQDSFSCERIINFLQENNLLDAMAVCVDCPNNPNNKKKAENQKELKKVVGEPQLPLHKDSEGLHEEIVNLLYAKSGADPNKATEIMANHIINKRKIINIRTNAPAPELWYYNKGIYLPHGHNIIEEECRKILIKFYCSSLKGKVETKIRADTQKDANDFFNAENIEYLPMQNGLLDFKDRKLVPFTHELIFFSKLPMAYDPDAKCPNTIQFFTDVLEHGVEDVKLMQELFGFCLYNEYFIHKAFLLWGKGRNGKGVTLRLLKSLLGEKNVSEIEIQSFQNEFRLVGLHKKKANLAGDISNTEMKETSAFKNATGQDNMTLDRKHKSQISFKAYAKQVFSCNEPPKVKDDSIGFWDRWIIFVYPHSFKLPTELALLSPKEKKKWKVANPNIDKILLKELPGILNWALEGLERIWKQNGFSVNRSLNDTKMLWLSKSSSFWAFAKEMIKIDNNGGGVTYDTFSGAYHDYCDEKGLVVETSFVTRLRELFPTNKATDSSGQHYWTKISIEGYPTRNEEKPTVEAVFEPLRVDNQK